jgi:hypothetical protein
VTSDQHDRPFKSRKPRNWRMEACKECELYELVKRISSDFDRSLFLWVLSKGFVDEGAEIFDDTEGLSGKDVLDRLKQFDLNLKSDEMGYVFMFIRLLCFFPKSMVDRNVSLKLKHLIYLIRWVYEKDYKKPLSFDSLSKMFLRSKSTIHEVMKGYADFKAELDRPDFKEQTNERTTV